jgi:hypothetical protein
VEQELQQFAEQLFGSLFRNVVAAWKCVTPHIACKAPPLLQRPEAFFDCAVRAPQREHVALDLAARREVRALVIQIDAGTGAIVLADTMGGAGRLEAAEIFGECLGRKVPALRLPMKLFRKNSGSALIRVSGNGAGWISRNQ